MATQNLPSASRKVAGGQFTGTQSYSIRRYLYMYMESVECMSCAIQQRTPGVAAYVMNNQGSDHAPTYLPSVGPGSPKMESVAGTSQNARPWQRLCMMSGLVAEKQSLYARQGRHNVICSSCGKRGMTLTQYASHKLGNAPIWTRDTAIRPTRTLTWDGLQNLPSTSLDCPYCGHRRFGCSICLRR